MNVKVILLQNIENIGKKGDILDVRKGFARNYLISHKLAKVATAGHLQQAQEQQQVAEKRQKEMLEKTEDVHKRLQKKAVTVKRKVTSKGNLYAAITPHDITREVFQTYGISIPEDTVSVETIKAKGSYAFKIHIPGGADIPMKVRVVPL